MARMPDWLKGLFAVLPTPMVAGGRLDPESLERVVDYYLDGGAAGLVPASIAGEGDLLDEAERRCVIQRVARRSGGRAPIVVGVLAECTQQAIADARVAAECGAAGLLVKPPRGDAGAVLSHVRAIAQALPLPLILLDNPAFGPTLPSSLIASLVEAVPTVCAVKVEDAPTPEKMARLRRLLGPRLRLFGGLGGLHALAELDQEADGFFTGNPYPARLVSMIASHQAGDRAAAAAAFEELRAAAAREMDCPAAMIPQRKLILRELGVLREAATRARMASSPLRG
jgi:4-hydroxy-tetrahydrodipicolinate synthase